MLHSRTCAISIISNQPKFPFPTKITVNADFELFGCLPFLAVYSELFRITQNRLFDKKLTDLSDVDGMYRDPETFSFDTDRGYIELKITLLPFKAQPSEYQIAFHPLQHIHETHFIVKKGYKEKNKIIGKFGLCMLNVLNPIKPKEFCMIAHTDEHVLQANVVVDLVKKVVEIGHATTPNRLRAFEVEMAQLYFNFKPIQDLIVLIAEKFDKQSVDEDAVYSTFIAPRQNRELSIRGFADISEYDNDV
jgi:hypothetical protein